MVWLLAASLALAADTAAVQTTARAVLVATVHARCDACAWDTEGREAVMLRVTVDGRYSQHLPLVRTGGSDYDLLLGTVEAGRHVVGVSVDRDRSAPGVRSMSADAVRIVEVEAIDGDDPRYPPLSHAPFVYQRANTIGRFTDMPVFMWYETEPTDRGTRYRYSVIFTNEDGGTPADRLMATWGRTTDIEYIYSVEVDRRGRVLFHDYQGPKHEVLPYRGRLEARHARLWVATDNNMVVDRGPTGVRFAPAPVEFPLHDVSREEVMDANPWLYAVSSKELLREHKIVPDAPPGNGVIPDPRRYVYVEGCGTVGTNAVAFAIQVGEQWISSDRGLPEYRIVRDGCFRSAIPLPGNATADDVRALRVHAFARPDKPAGAPVRFARVNTMFTLDENFVPGPRLVQWHGTAELQPGGPPLEISLK